MVCLKIPNCTHIVCVVLIVVVLIAITEILFPCVVCIVLTGTPIVVRSKTFHKGVYINTRLLIFIAELSKTFYFFSVLDSPVFN